MLLRFDTFQIKQLSSMIFLLAVNQEYETDAEKEYVIIGNSVLMKCKIPSFVADFVSVESWKDNFDNEYFSGMSMCSCMQTTLSFKQYYTSSTFLYRSHEDKISTNIYFI